MPKKKTTKAPASETLLVELLTEELPPKSLRMLSEAFGTALLADLAKDKFLPKGAGARTFATPRRIAVQIERVSDRSPDEHDDKKGPAKRDAYDASGNPTEKLMGFLRKHGASLELVRYEQLAKGEVVVISVPVKGRTLDEALSQKVEATLKALPIPKTMRWGNDTAEFVRPVHGLVMMHGSRVIPGDVLGLKSTSRTLGHRFLSGKPITLRRADDYERALRDEGKVIADFAARRAEIVKKLERAAGNNTKLVADDDLIDEIAALVEAPAVYAAEFNVEFLAVPEECLILSMQQHQRYVPLRDKATGKLLSRFLFVSNIKASDPREIIHGNERVLHARLADAKFFFEQDKKSPLPERLPALKRVVYQNKLGTQFERVERIKNLATAIGRLLDLTKQDLYTLERAAHWCKCDLVTDMVGEFPELQGIMGKHYLLATDKSWDTPQIAQAIEEHYRPRFAGDQLPESRIGTCVSLADKLDSLSGLFGIGQVPTGEKDPYGLRRAALGVIRILIEKTLPLDAVELFETARNGFSGQLSADVSMNLHAFFMDRLRPYLRERGYAPDEIDAVLAVTFGRLDQVLPRLDAVKKFRTLPEGIALSAANKRIHNILRQAYPHLHLGAGGYELRQDGDVGIGRNSTLLREDAERKLDRELESAMGDVGPMLRENNYAAALRRLATLRPTVDSFFDKVMVMVDDADVRNNRLALLKDLGNLFLLVADVSRLQG